MEEERPEKVEEERLEQMKEESLEEVEKEKLEEMEEEKLEEMEEEKLEEIEEKLEEIEEERLEEMEEEKLEEMEEEKLEERLEIHNITHESNKLEETKGMAECPKSIKGSQDEKTKAERQGTDAAPAGKNKKGNDSPAKCRVSVFKKSPLKDLRDDTETKDRASHVDQPMQNEVEHTRTEEEEERDTDDEGKRQMGHNDVVTQPHRRHHGLKNQGATCYLNSVLQVLFGTTEIHDRLDQKLDTDRQLRNLFEEMKKRTCGTKTITAAFEVKSVYEQRDAAECLEMILHKISQQASELFQGKLQRTTKCSEGHIIIEETKPFWTLPLPLKDAHNETISVERSFERTFNTKPLTGVYCNECNNKTDATSGCEMVKDPQILTVLLKRFVLDSYTMSYVKSNCCVDVPHALQRENKRYTLYGMVNHRGSVRGGHYTATVLSDEDKTWYRCDDTYVSEVEGPSAENTTYSSHTAYMLMYRASVPQIPHKNNSGGLTNKAVEEQDETSNLKELRGDEAEHQRNEHDTDKRKCHGGGSGPKSSTPDRRGNVRNDLYFKSREQKTQFGKSHREVGTRRAGGSGELTSRQTRRADRPDEQAVDRPGKQADQASRVTRQVDRPGEQRNQAS